MIFKIRKIFYIIPRGPPGFFFFQVILLYDCNGCKDICLDQYLKSLRVFGNAGSSVGDRDLTVLLTEK